MYDQTDVARRLLIRDLALADGTSPRLRLGDGGATLVPGMVDAHSHLSGPGGSHWIERFSDPLETLTRVGHENARRLIQGGVLWARDVGSDFGGGSVRAGHLAWEIELLVQAGLDPWEALAAATLHGGELLGEEHAV